MRRGCLKGSHDGLAGSGLPLTAPFHFGVPVGTEGARANVGALGSPSASASAAGSSASAGYPGQLQTAIAINNPDLSGLHLFIAGQQIF